MAEPIISFRDFSFQYRAQKQPTLKHINLDVYPGEKVIIVGSSGSGKSTIAACINGLIPAVYPGEISGTLTVGGMDVSCAGIFDLSAYVGTVLQDPDGQFIGLTVGEDIAFSLENELVPTDRMHEKVKECARVVGMEHLLDASPLELSGGQKQRVSLAGVIVHPVKILLFDEPLANLDPASGKQTIELVDRIQKQTGTTVIIIEHRLEDALWCGADRIVLVDDGCIIADNTPDELLSSELLRECGIREPLYLTAMRYSGIRISPENSPSHPLKVRISQAEREMLKAWYEKAPLPIMQAEKRNVLEVKNLCFSYDGKKQVLSDISFCVRKGEMVSVVGTNGAGKSTLSKIICGFENQTSGSVFLNGRCIDGQNIRSRAKSIGYVMQDPNQMISKSMIFDEVALGLRGTGLAESQIKVKVEETLKICGLYPFRNWPVSALSFGQKKRMTIASVLVMGPEIIILDEPTAGQDYRHYTDIMEFLCELNKRGVTVIMITHDMHLMLEYTPRTLVIHDGILLADRSSASVLCDPGIVKQASLKETSLYLLAKRCGIQDAEAFAERFILFEKEVHD